MIKCIAVGHDPNITTAGELAQGSVYHIGGEASIEQMLGLRPPASPTLRSSSPICAPLGPFAEESLTENAQTYESHKHGSRLSQMGDSGPFPDDVPLADALEQLRPAAEAADLETVDPDERVPTENGETPLESNPPDWQEQHQVVETHDEDQVREE